MKWNELSNEAKSVIEWVENPFTNKNETVEIKIGEVFHQDCPQFWCSIKNQEAVNITITDELFNEILNFVEQDENIDLEKIPDDMLRFWLK